MVRSETHSAGALRGLAVAVPELLEGVTGETGDLELAGTQGINPTDGEVVAERAVTKVEAKAVRA